MGGEVKVVVEPADDSDLTEMMLTGEATAELLMAVVFLFGTLLLLLPGLLLFLLVLVRIRGSVVPEVDEEVDEEVDDRRSLARRNDGSRGAADEEACLFDTPIDGIVAQWRLYDGFDLGIPIQRHQGSKQGQGGYILWHRDRRRRRRMKNVPLFVAESTPAMIYFGGL